MSFREEIETLETLLNQLESPDIAIDEAIPLYEKALTQSKTIMTQFKTHSEKLSQLDDKLSQLSFEDFSS